MRVIDGSHQGTLTINGETVDVGDGCGRVEVASGGLLQLHGMVVGELFHVDGGAQLWAGKGDVQNLGGAVHIYGMIDGKVLHRSGSTTYYQGAVVDGICVPNDRSVGAQIIAKHGRE